MRRLGLALSLVTALLAALAAACTGSPAPGSTPTPKVPTTVVVFLRDDATAAQKKAVEDELRAAPAVESVTFVSREQAYREFKEKFADDPELQEGVRPEDMPESYRVRLTDRGRAPASMRTARGLPGVDDANEAPRATPLTTGSPQTSP